MEKTFLDIYGCNYSIESESKVAIMNLHHDFSYFLRKNNNFYNNSFKITISKGHVKGKKKRSTLINIFGNQRNVVFFGSVLVKYDFIHKSCEIFFSDETYVYEVLWFVIMSSLGELLDLKGIHRIHGFGIRTTGGLLFLGPSGIGKSTFLLEILKKTKAQILAEDLVFVSKDDFMLFFPQRIALIEKPDIEEKYIRKFKRFNYAEKYVISSLYFKDRISEKSKITKIILLTKKNLETPQIRIITKLKLINSLLKWLIIGYETPQIWELFIRFSFSDILLKIKILIGRISCAWSLIKSCEAYEFQLSSSIEKNKKKILEFVENSFKDSQIRK